MIPSVQAMARWNSGDSFRDLITISRKRVRSAGNDHRAKARTQHPSNFDADLAAIGEDNLDEGAPLRTFSSHSAMKPPSQTLVSRPISCRPQSSATTIFELHSQRAGRCT